MPQYDLTAVYIVANRRQGRVYVGVTSDLISRVRQHRLGGGAAFAVRHGCASLVWWERHLEMAAATARREALRRLTRRDKLALIESANPTWRDLFDDVVAEHGRTSMWERPALWS